MRACARVCVSRGCPQKSCMCLHEEAACCAVVLVPPLTCTLPAPPPCPRWRAACCHHDEDGAGPVRFVDNGWDVWGDWRRAANVHYRWDAPPHTHTHRLRPGWCCVAAHAWPTLKHLRRAASRPACTGSRPPPLPPITTAAFISHVHPPPHLACPCAPCFPLSPTHTLPAHLPPSWLRPNLP